MLFSEKNGSLSFLNLAVMKICAFTKESQYAFFGIIKAKMHTILKNCYFTSDGSNHKTMSRHFPCTGDCIPYFTNESVCSESPLSGLFLLRGPLLRTKSSAGGRATS